MEALTLTPREYQSSIAKSAYTANTLVVLPTGLGKTLIAAQIAVHTLNAKPTSKVLFLAPTKPLIQQHYTSFSKQTTINPDSMVMLTGETTPIKRAQAFADASIIFSTPQGLENDVLSKRISLKDVGLIVFDEAHRAQGDYSYVWIAKNYSLVPNFHILALTASPGSDKESIEMMCDNLFIQHVEQRDTQSPDVQPYVHKTTQRWIDVELNDEYKRVITHLKELISQKVKAVQQQGMLTEKDSSRISKFDILTLQKQLQGFLVKKNFAPEILQSLSLSAQIMKLQHALELVESQGIAVFLTYIDDMYEQAKTTKTKATKVLAQDPILREAYYIAKQCQSPQHPKLTKLSEMVTELLTKKRDAKLIVFNQYRDSIQHITQHLNTFDVVRAETFVGQAKKRGLGLSQKEQIKRLEDFSAGKYNVLVMSSVGEEGLDIPQVDGVIFYEPVPSAIRSIQRRGRTGRHFAGSVQILVAKGTRDEAYKWSAHHKEKRAKKIIETISPSKSMIDKPQKNLDAFGDKPTHMIIADSREQTRELLHELDSSGVHVSLKKLDVADYVISSDVGVEYKHGKDFVDSLLDGRLFSQAKKLKESFARPLMIVQSEQDIYSLRNVHPHAIQGALMSLHLDYGLPVFFTTNTQQTAHTLASLAKKYQSSGGQHFTPATSVKETTPIDVVAALPGVGPQSAQALLKHFGDLKSLFSTQKKDLEAVEGIGKKRAEQLEAFFREKSS